jgi:hypothetical protein
MADDPKPQVPTANPPDPFAGAVTTLRDTLKWLTTTFAGVIGVVIAGTSLTGITKLSGSDRTVALLGCGLGLLCLVIAIGLLLHLLLPQTFYFGELVDKKNRRLRDRLDAHATLPSRRCVIIGTIPNPRNMGKGLSSLTRISARWPTWPTSPTTK